MKAKAIMQAPELPADKREAPQRKTQAPALPKKNPSFKYFLKIQKGHGPILTWNGKSFTDRPDDVPHAFAKKSTAERVGKNLYRRFRILDHYKMLVVSGFQSKSSIIDDKKQRAMRGGTKSNPGKRTRDAELDQAAKRLEEFSGHPVQHLESAYSRSPQRTGLIIGELDLVGYRAKRDGKLERYGHHFKKNSRPLLAVTSDGKQLHIVGGQYEFTEAGIEDR